MITFILTSHPSSEVSELQSPPISTEYNRVDMFMERRRHSKCGAELKIKPSRNIRAKWEVKCQYQWKTEKL
ncbi:MAG: hypothetical protein QXU47_03165 [Candidatus Bathyarchaeia archaeon]